MNLRKLIFLSALLLVVFACEKDQTCNGEIVTMKNFTGLDGCGWVLLRSNDEKLEPTNINDFGIALEEDKSVCIKYHSVAAGSICMVGTVVEIESMVEQ